MLRQSFDSVLAAAQTGAEWALTELYRELNPALRRFFAAQTRDAADDLAQETWIAAGRTLGAFEGDERAFRAWLFTIARRTLVAHWRAQGRRPSVPVDPATLTAIPDDAGTSRLEAAEAAAALIAGLPADQAEVVLLRVVAGLDADEVAEIVGKSPGAVRVMQHRALRRIARRLEHEKDL